MQKIIDTFRGMPLFPHQLLVGLFVFIGTVIFLFSFGILGPSSTFNFQREDESEGIVVYALEDVIQHGQERWTQMRAEGIDIASGPCLDDSETFSGWAIDLVREGRVDYLPENQCASFLSGKTTRLIEISLDGNVVRVVPEGLWQSQSTLIP